MHQVKFFKGIESELTSLQDQINEWIRAENIKVVNILGNIAPQTMKHDASIGRQFAPSDIFIIVIHEA